MKPKPAPSVAAKATPKVSDTGSAAKALEKRRKEAKDKRKEKREDRQEIRQERFDNTIYGQADDSGRAAMAGKMMSIASGGGDSSAVDMMSAFAEQKANLDQQKSLEDQREAEQLRYLQLLQRLDDLEGMG
jgi:hypothetical protein|tara:strand:- start:317 stop:709 length:393 start_codon:yes stop_codon:yes gene_type:complete